MPDIVIPAFTPSLEDRREVAAAIAVQAARSYVDSVVSPSDREVLAAMLQKVTLGIVMGVPATSGREWALSVLVATLGWVEAALALGASLKATIDASDTPEDIVFRPEDLPAPPHVDLDAIVGALA